MRRWAALGALFLLGCTRSATTDPGPGGAASGGPVPPGVTASVAVPAASAAPAGVAASASAAPTVSLPPLERLTTGGAGVRSQVVPLEPGQTVVVWVRLPPQKNQILGDDVSHFLRPDGTILASKPGVYLARGEVLYKHNSVTRELDSAKCAPDQLQPPMDKQVLRETALVRERDGARTLLIPFEEGQAAEGGEASEQPAIEQEVIPLAYAGSTYFVAAKTSLYLCGALHQRFSRVVRAFRIDERGAVRELDLSTLESAARDGLAEATQRFNKTASREKDSPDGPRSGSDLSLTAEYPIFSAQGVRWQVQFTGAASWAGTDHLTTGYARSVQVALDLIPAALSDAARLPKPAHHYLKAHPKEQVLGVSVGKISLPTP